MGSMNDFSTSPPKPWIATPCIHSAPLSRAAGCNIFLKLENLQPSGSFKSRGIGNLMVRALQSAGPSAASVHFFCSSGGNAGLACVTAAAALGRPATVVVPLTTPPHMVARLRELGADVVQLGENWAAADGHLREELIAAHRAAGGAAVYVPPFDHPDIWEGAATLVDELAAQMEAPVDGVVCSVGGGGLLCGVMEGAQRLSREAAELGGAKWRVPPRVLAVETKGAASLHASVEAGELVTLPGITSIATSLGAPRVAVKAFEWTQKAGREGLVSAVVSDADAIMGCSRFLDDARMLIEAACGATIATAYNGALRRELGEGLSNEEWAKKNVVLVVCGGSNINLKMLEEYKKKYDV
ncbi:Tryptophan synthase beta subunit-like PLP-dependent enzyme [Pleurostoma richardsiae]|uniref:L-serine ammonia-lyase n=1 Tax=Pleurostoma richardsiae TaxID=41990 RepID=A0AA38RZE5_9PEZI|nr:Tryptophan synthase beta subunit-like PLP-dependent enzyme [Pleurostoma richardsiae]